MDVDSTIARLDSFQLVQLRGLAGIDEHLMGGNMPRNVLNFFYDSAYYTPPQLPEEFYDKWDHQIDAPVATLKEERSDKAEVKTTFKLYPNPAQNSITIDYSGISDNSRLYIVNMLGNILEDKILPDGAGKIILNTATYQNGVYFAHIQTGKNAMIKNKFIILK